MNTEYEKVQRYERGLSLNDLDRFADLEWEREVSEHANRNRANRRQPVNLTAKIEDYLKGHI